MPCAVPVFEVVVEDVANVQLEIGALPVQAVRPTDRCWLSGLVWFENAEFFAEDGDC